MCPDLVGRENSGTALGLMDALAYAGAAAQGPILGYYIERGGSLGYGTMYLLLAAAAAGGAVLAIASAVTAPAAKVQPSAAETDVP